MIYSNLKFFKYLKPESISECDQFCENSFPKRTHHTIGQEGSWFCRGLWGHTDNKKEGGCEYWKREDNPNVEDCEQECTDADFGGVGYFPNGTEVCETVMCKAGCNFNGIEIFKFNRLQTLEYSTNAVCLNSNILMILLVIYR